MAGGPRFARDSPLTSYMGLRGLPRQEITDWLSEFPRLDVQDRGVGRVGVFGGLPPWLADGLLTVSPRGLFSVPAHPWSLSSSSKETRLIGLGSTPQAPFLTSWLLKVPPSPNTLSL